MNLTKPYICQPPGLHDPTVINASAGVNLYYRRIIASRIARFLRDEVKRDEVKCDIERLAQSDDDRTKAIRVQFTPFAESMSDGLTRLRGGASDGRNPDRITSS
jgi:hypothetical protein